MSYHPDPAISEALERNAQAVTRETVAPPPEIADDPAAYIRWLREQRPQLQPRRVVNRFSHLYDQPAAPHPRRPPVQDAQPASPLAWSPTPEEVEQLDGHGAARYRSALSVQNDARNAALAGLAAQIARPRRQAPPSSLHPAPKTEQELAAEKARQLAALQPMVDQEQQTAID